MALSLILLGVVLILLAVILYQRKKYSVMQKRFIDLLTERDKKIDRLEKSLTKTREK